MAYVTPNIAYGPEKPSGYVPRLVDARLQRLLGLFGAVEVRGTKWCGKSWCSFAFGQSVTFLDDGNMRTLAMADPKLALRGASPHVVDEWQEVPAVWDAVRRAIDASGAGRGLYILTGSSTPEKGKVSHSGAGRIARLDMSTMTLLERGIAHGGVSLSRLFASEFEPGSAQHDVGLAELADAICVGGWPALVAAPPLDAAEVVGHYLAALFDVSVPKKGGVSQTARRLALSLARNVASAATLDTLAADAGLDDRGTEMARSTVRTYLDLFEDLFFIESLPGWDAPVRSRSRLRTKPKRYFADPSIAASLLGMSPVRLLADSQTFGLMFESLCVHELLVFSSLLPGSHAHSLRYYGDADGLEVDVVIELDDGRWAAIEVKLGEDKVPKGIASLRRLAAKVAANPAARNLAPEFMMVLTAVSPMWRQDTESGVYVVPITALEP